MEEEREHQVAVQSASHSNLQDPAKGELPTEDAGEDMRPEVIHPLEKQQEQQPLPQESQEEALEARELESESKQEKEDQVETFFSNMSHRYEEPLALWSIKNETDTLSYACVTSSLSYRTHYTPHISL